MPLIKNLDLNKPTNKIEFYLIQAMTYCEDGHVTIHGNLYLPLHYLKLALDEAEKNSIQIPKSQLEHVSFVVCLGGKEAYLQQATYKLNSSKLTQNDLNTIDDFIKKAEEFSSKINEDIRDYILKMFLDSAKHHEERGETKCRNMCLERLAYHKERFNPKPL